MKSIAVHQQDGTAMRSQVEIVRHNFLSRGFLGAYITTMRPYLLFVSGITGISGMSFGGSIAWGKSIAIFVSCFFSYGFGQAMTDCFQIDTDSLSSPYRPLVQGTVSRPVVFTVSMLGLVACVSALAVESSINLLLGALAGFGLITYTPFKRKWWAGPFYNAWIVVVLFLMAMSAASAGGAGSFPRPASWAVFAVFFGYANFVLAGYFKDVEADRATNYRTLPVVFGRAVSALASDALALLTVIPTFAAMWEIHSPPASRTIQPLSILFAAGGIAAAVRAQLRLHRVRRDSEAHPAIALTVHAYILLLSAVVSLQKPEWGGFLVLHYLAFVLVLKGRPAREQI